MAELSMQVLSLLTTTDLSGPTFWMPEQASTVAPDIDGVLSFINRLCYFFFTIIVGLLIYFAVRYRRPKGTPAEGATTHNTPLELTWTIVPLILVIAIFYVGLRGYMNLRRPPAETYLVRVTAQKWTWTFEHPNGASEVGTLRVPAGRPVRLLMQSEDVLHSLYIPAFRVKQDVIPGRRTQLWFEAVLPPDWPAAQPQVHDLFCAEYCGTQHSQMLAEVLVYDPDTFQEVIESVASEFERVPDDELACYAARRLYPRCSSCHTLDGRALTGPSWKGLWQRTLAGETVFTDGSTLADHMKPGGAYEVPENYIIDSINNPQKHIVMNFTGSMPTFKAQLKPRQVEALLALIRNLDQFLDENDELVIPEGCGEARTQQEPADDDA